jgi:parallel beta-helix repeat protein
MLTGVLGAGGAPTGVVYFVATNGNDSWSGKLPAPNKDKTDGPFSSIVRARDAIRALRGGGGLTQPVTVQIRGGVYYVPETIVFGPQDSGTKDCPVSYVAYRGEKPELCGGRRVTGWSRPGMVAPRRVLSVSLPDVKEGKWTFRQLFVYGPGGSAGERQTRARCPNVDPTDPYRKGFFYVDKRVEGLGGAVGNIHNPGDWMDYRVKVPADGEFQFWMFYGALNQPFGTTDMGGRTVLIVDGGEPILLLNLPDTGGWNVSTWSVCATLRLTAGTHVLRWQNVKGGGLDIGGYALSDDPGWKPVGTNLPKAAEGKHVVVIAADSFEKFDGRQLSVSSESGAGSTTEMRYQKGTFKPAWAQAPGAEVHVFQTGNCRAFKEIVSIAGVDEGTRTVSLTGKECTSLIYAGDRYFVENVFEELDSPAEWYLNQQTGVLYYWPKEGFSEKSEVIAPVLGRVFDFEADPAKQQTVSYIRLAGLTVRDTEYYPTDGCEAYGTGNDGAVYLKGATNCAIENCTFHNTGRYAVCLTGSSDNRVVGNEIGHSAEGGVLLLVGAARNTVSDNHIHHCGIVYKHIGGVILEGSGTDENVIAHNDIHDMSRYGISLKGAGSRNVIEYNRVRRTNLETFDTGGIEVTQQDKDFRSGSIIRNNIVGDTFGWYADGPKRSVYLSWGIYLDSFAGGYTVTNNITYRNSHGGIMFQGGKDNKVENNIFVDSSYSQAYISNFADNSEGLTLERNIFYFTDPKAMLFATGRLDEKVIRVDRNLYCHAGSQDLTINGAPLADWQKRGFDANSVIADPLFVNAKADDYSLRPDSPAFKLGFQPIDTSKVGIRRPR